MWPVLCRLVAKPAVCFGVGLEQERQEEEKLRTVLERVKAAAAPLPQRLAELRDAVEREARDLQRREAGQPLTAVGAGSLMIHPPNPTLTPSCKLCAQGAGCVVVDCRWG